MLFLPIGHDQAIRRFPWLTVAIMAICILLQVARTAFGPSMQDLSAAEAVRDQKGFALLDRMHAPAPELDDPSELPAPTSTDSEGGSAGVLPARRPIVLPPELAQADSPKLLEAVRAGRLGDPNDPAVIAFRAADAQLQAVQGRDLVLRWGYRPTSGASPNLLLAAFVHGGWVHLAGNLLFLWLCGCNLEDRWGRVAFGSMYFVSAILSSAAYGLVHRGSDVPLVGASGAIAGAMGAFLVCYHSARIKYWWWWGFKTGTLYLPAYIAFPFWFLSQLGQTLLEVSGFGEVAYSAHVGGFGFGLLAALVLRFSGLEARWLLEQDEDDDAPSPELLPSTSQVPARGWSKRPSHRPYVRPSLRPRGDGALYRSEHEELFRAKPTVSSHPAAPFEPMSHAPEIPRPARMPDLKVPDVAPWPPPELSYPGPASGGSREVEAPPPQSIASTVPQESPFEALRRAVEADPSRDDLRYELCKHAIDQRDPELVDATATRTFLWLAEQERWRDIVALYDTLSATGIERPLSDRAFSMIVRAAVETNDPKRCVTSAQKMANTHPSSPLLPRALWDVANAQHKGGRPDLARKTFTMLVERFPQHRFADEARKRLS